MTSTLYDTAAELSATAADLAAAIDTDEPTDDLACRAANLLTDLNAGLAIGVPPEVADLRQIARRLRRDLDANRRPGLSDFNLLDFQALVVAEEAGELVGAYRRWSGRARRTGTLAELQDEVADVLIVTAVFAERAGIDLNEASARKLTVIYHRGWRAEDTNPANARLLHCARSRRPAAPRPPDPHAARARHAARPARPRSATPL